MGNVCFFQGCRHSRNSWRNGIPDSRIESLCCPCRCTRRDGHERRFS